MNWSLPDFTAPSNAEEIYKQMCDRNGVDVALVSHGGSEDAHTIFQLGTLARKKFAQHYQPGRKSIFTPATLLEKSESDKGDETDILEDDKIQLLDSLHIQHGRLTNREIAFILAIRAITVSNLACTHVCAPITGRFSYLLHQKIRKFSVIKHLLISPMNGRVRFEHLRQSKHSASLVDFSFLILIHQPL